MTRETKQPSDPLEHFRGERPGWKLAALLLCKLPYIVAAGVAALVVWGRHS
jgi:hypothetical protein